MQVYDLTKELPDDESETMSAPLRVASRRVCETLTRAKVVESYFVTFQERLLEAECCCAEMQQRLRFVTACGYASEDVVESLEIGYDILKDLIREYRESGAHEQHLN
jgi:hypothetical protein